MAEATACGASRAVARLERTRIMLATGRAPSA
jgi:hypothetical protein